MNGLSSKEVLKSRVLHGSNKLPEPKLDKWYDFAKEALSEKITMILIAIAVLQLFLGVMGVMDLSDPIMILVVLAIVTCIAVKTGLGVQKSAAELRAKTSVRYCDVIRDGKVQTINKDELVVGDLVCVGMGQEIFADGYLIEGKISVNNAAINGETKECKKTPIEGYVHKKTTSTDAYTNQNCLFAGTTVMSGEGKMIVTDVGVNTVNGDTLVKMQTLEAPKTALDIALDNLSDFISKWGTIAAVITFAVLTISGVIQVGYGEYFSGGVLNIIQKIAQNFSVALTIIVAAVPEGLPLIVKLVTKQNVKTMEKFNILAKNPGKIPELAYVDIICTDKTGTLTTGIMTPKKIIDGFGNEVNKDSVLWNNIEANISLNNSATFDSENNITGGNSIDRAVLSLVNPETYADIQKTYPVKLKQVFNSSNKYSAFTTKDGITYYKGAPEKLIEHCTKVMDSSGEIVDNNDNDKLSNAITAMTSNAMRCIAVTMADGDLVENEIPNGMTFLGIIGVVDPVRDEVPSAVKTAKLKREIDTEGEGWKLFQKFVEAKNNTNPKYFLYENNYGMADEIQDAISEELGVQPIMIDSQLLSAQRRKRLYWTNIPNITLPDDKGLLVKDVICDDPDLVKYFDDRIRNTMIKCENYIKYDLGGKGHYSQQDRLYFLDKKAPTVPRCRTETKFNVWLGGEKYKKTCH